MNGNINLDLLVQWDGIRNFEIKLRKKCGTTAQGSVAWSDWSEIKTISCNASND